MRRKVDKTLRRVVTGRKIPMTEFILPQDAASASPSATARALQGLFTILATEHERRMRWLTLLHTAAQQLQTVDWEYDAACFVIDNVPLQRATVTLWGCSCAAWVDCCQCWHYAAFRIVVCATHLAHTRATTGYASPAALQADIEMLFR